MSLYSWSANVSTHVPVDAGGCGVTHSRPVVDGAPQHPWRLDCPPCEDFLRVHNADQWSTTTTEIPETYDESRARESAEKSGKLDRENQLAAAIIELGKLGQLPEALGQVLAPMLGAPVAALAGKVVCPGGHDNTAGVKFCGECGVSMSGQAAISAPQHAAGPQRPAGPVRIQDLRHDELQAACRARGLEDQGVRKELMKRLRSAGVSNADLQRLLVAA
jgi:SAP domain